MRGGASSFRVFARDTPAAAAGAGDETPTVHELFAAATNDQLPLREFARLLVDLHGLHLTPAAAKLLTSVDAASGRLSFAQFQKALGGAAEEPEVGAGQRYVFDDCASAIISDNCGAPQAPPSSHMSGAKLSTDISAGAEELAKRSRANEVRQAQKGAFGTNPVMRTNRASAGNPLAGGAGGGGEPAAEDGDPYGSRVMAQTATRMYYTGELDRQGFEKFLTRFGVAPGPESEVRRLIERHERAGDGNFADMTRALNREIARTEATDTKQ